MNEWLYSLKHYWLMCFFASGPDRLPAGYQSATYSLLAYLAAGLFLTDENRRYGDVVAQIGIELLLLGIIAYLGLFWRKKLPRFLQTFSALLGVNLVMSLVAIPLFLMSADTRATGTETSWLTYLTMAIIFWNLAVISLILKRALEISTWVSTMIAFNYFLFYQFLTVTIFYQ